jgi:putative oxidoreductase
MENPEQPAMKHFSPILAFAARVAIGALLVAAGALKIGHAPELASAIAGFRLLPAAVIPLLALVLPFFEVLLGLYLLAGLFTRIAAWVAAAQFALYAAAIASAVLRGIPANCGCFGPSDAAVADWPHVAMDAALAILCVALAVRAPGAGALDERMRSR